MFNLAALVGPAALATKEFTVHPQGSADGLYVRIVGRKSGLFAWLLSLLQIDATTIFEVYQDRIVFKSANLSGATNTTVPLASVCLTASGFFKPVLYIILAVLLFVPASMGLLAALMVASHSSEAAFAAGCFPMILLAFCALLVWLYFLRKTLLVSIQANSGTLIAIAFKRSVMEGVTVEAEDAERVISLVNQLLLGQQSRTLPVPQLPALVSPQAPRSAVSPAAVVPPPAQTRPASAPVPPVRVAPTARNCPSCSASVPMDALFCEACGKRVG